jgi:hypothetical protein
MAESQFSQTVMAYSTAVESTYGTHPVLANLYTPTVTRSRAVPLPQTEKTDDRGVIGKGDDEDPSYQRSGFSIPSAFELSDIVQVGSVLPLIRRYMGAVAGVPSTVEATIAFRHAFFLMNRITSGLQLPSSSFVYSLNEFDYIHTGCVGSTLQFAQQGTADPTYTLGLVGSGRGVRISQIAPPFGSLAVPGDQPYMYGASSAMQYVDDSAATISLTTPSHKLRSMTFSANNNLDTGDTRAGMPQNDANEPRRGWYRDFLHIGDRDVSMEWTMGMDSDYTLKDAEELNVQIAKFNLRSPAVGEASNNKSTKAFTVFPLKHAGYYGRWKLEAVNGVATAIS